MKKLGNNYYLFNNLQKYLSAKYMNSVTFKIKQIKNKQLT